MRTRKWEHATTHPNSLLTAAFVIPRYNGGMKRAQILSFLLIGATACNGGTATPGDGGASDLASDNPTPASITISGALSGSTQSTGPVAASWSNVTNVSAVIFLHSGGPVFNTNVSFTFAGQPTTTTYTQVTPGLACVVTVSDYLDLTRSLGGEQKCRRLDGSGHVLADDWARHREPHHLQPAILHGAWVGDGHSSAQSGTASGTITYNATF